MSNTTTPLEESDSTSSNNKKLTLQEKAKKEGKELISALFWALLVAGIIRTFVFEPFTIPSGSMVPTLLVGDYIYVDKYAYGYSRWSFPWGYPAFSGRLFFSEPQKGDIIVFKAPKKGDDKFYIKRLVGNPGDTVQMIGGQLHINEKKLPLTAAGSYTYIDENTGRTFEMQKFLETLPNGVKHYLIKFNAFGHGHYDNTIAYHLPDKHYFMMGDNRDFSGDSRSRFTMGDIPEDKLIGKALFVFFSTTAKWYQIFKWIEGIRYERIFKGLYNLSWQTKKIS